MHKQHWLKGENLLFSVYRDVNEWSKALEPIILIKI